MGFSIAWLNAGHEGILVFAHSLVFNLRAHQQEDSSTYGCLVHFVL